MEKGVQEGMESVNDNQSSAPPSEEEDRIAKAVEFSAFKQLQKAEAEEGFVERSVHSEKFFRSGRSGGWQEKLTPAQARQIESDHAVQMKRYGYL